MSNRNEVFEYLIDVLRQQVDNNPYKQQCEDLAHEVRSLKNQLRNTSALVAELQETIKLMNEDFKRTTANPEYREELRQYYKDMMSMSEQSGCRKEDTQECRHDFVNSKHKYLDGVFKPAKDCVHEWVRSDSRNANVCHKCGAERAFTAVEQSGCRKEDVQECEHEWLGMPGIFLIPGSLHNREPYDFCRKCGAKK